MQTVVGQEDAQYDPVRHPLRSSVPDARLSSRVELLVDAFFMLDEARTAKATLRKVQFGKGETLLATDEATKESGERGQQHFC